MIETLTPGLIFPVSFIPCHRDLFNFVGVAVKRDGLSREESLVMSVPGCFSASIRLQYDANGNLITGDGKYREYNAFNQLVKGRHEQHV